MAAALDVMVLAGDSVSLVLVLLVADGVSAGSADGRSEGRSSTGMAGLVADDAADDPSECRAGGGITLGIVLGSGATGYAQGGGGQNEDSRDVFHWFFVIGTGGVRAPETPGATHLDCGNDTIIWTPDPRIYSNLPKYQ